MRSIHTYKYPRQTDWNSLAFIIIYVIFLMFWISRNSYTHDLFANVDNSWYFTCGKSWMSGMTPYVDFADSKGPLLWLIYGLAYLISPLNYIGVFWIECLFYIVTLWLVYKTARIFCKDKSAALATTFMTSLFFFNSLHFETKTEDFCMPFIAAGLYATMKLYYRNDNNILLTTLILGIGLASCLLIKYSISIIYIAFFIACFWHIAIYSKQKLIPAFLMSFVGFLIIAMPFAVYFIAIGNFNTFINEYFINTYLTVHQPIKETIYSYFTEDLWKIFSFRKTTYSLFVLTIICGTLLFCIQRQLKYRFIPLLMVIWIIAIAARHNITNHYMLVAAPFGVLTVLALSNVLKRQILLLPTKLKPIISAILSIIIIITVWQKIWKHPNFFLNDNNDRHAFYNTVALINSVENPTYMSAVVLPMFDVPTNALPACRYWILQTGATDEMINSRNDAIRQRKADFIIWADLPKSTHPDSQKLLLQSGYRVVYSDTIREVFRNRVAYKLYARSDIKLHGKPIFHMSDIDILLKKTLK